MAEIPLHKKSSLKWLWILLGLLLFGLIIWSALADDEDAVAGGEDQTELVGAVAGAQDPSGLAGSQETGGGAAGAATAGGDLNAATEGARGSQGTAIANILANPQAYVGRDDFQGEVSVPQVPTDRGFWIEDQGQRLFAVIIDDPREAPLDINQGQQLRITNGMLRDATFLSQLPGEAITSATRRIIQNQAVFLVVDEKNIEVLSR